MKQDISEGDLVYHSFDGYIDVKFFHNFGIVLAINQANEYDEICTKVLYSDGFLTLSHTDLLKLIQHAKY